MSKSRMFGDDEPESPNPSPRTTIVGGRPPEENQKTFPVPTGIQSLLRLAAEDEAFLQELSERRDEIARVAGVELSESEKAILKAIPTEQLVSMVKAIPPAPAPRRDFLRQTAATAVLLLGGAALDGCDSCSKVTGSRPDVPGEKQEPAKPLPKTRGISPDIPEEKPLEPAPERPEERPSPPGGARPDLPEENPKPKPPVEQNQGQFAKPPPGWDGGTPKPPPAEPPPERPDNPPKTRGIRPDRPPRKPKGKK